VLSCLSKSSTWLLKVFKKTFNTKLCVISTTTTRLKIISFIKAASQELPKQGTKKPYVPQNGTKCATARHQKTFRLICHRKAQNVPYHSTKTFRVMCHRTAQNVLTTKAQNLPKYSTKRLLGCSDMAAKNEGYIKSTTIYQELD
jgi:hypothetical protein